MSQELVIRITGDQSGLQKATDDSIGTLKGFGSKVSALSVAAGNLLADGIKTGFRAAGGFLKDSVGAASDLGETSSKVGVLFGDAAGQVEKFAGGAATSLGQSKQQAMDAAATFATFGKSAGLTGTPLAKFSTDLVGLSSDLASFSNTSPEDAIQAIGSALRGENEPMRRYGVLLDDVSMRQEALAMGITSSTKDALTPQQKVLAAQSLIFKQTSAAQGDFGRTSGGLANQQRILAANIDNVKTRIGTALLPAVLSIAQSINTKVIPVLSAWAEKYGPAVEAALGRLGGWISKIAGLFQSGGISSAGSELLKTWGSLWLKFVEFMTTTVYPATVSALARIGKALGGWITETAVPYLQANLPIWLQTLSDWFSSTAWPWISEKALALAALLGGWIADASDYLSDNLPKWIDKFSTWYETTASPWLKEKTGELAEKLGDWVEDAAERLVRNLPGWIAKFQGWIDSDALPLMQKFGTFAALAIKDYLLASMDFMGEIASSIAKGIAKGLWGLAGYVWDEIYDFVKTNVAGAIKGALGINSPSRIAIELGMGVAEGLVLGMDRGRNVVSGASDRLALAAIPSVGMGAFTSERLAVPAFGMGGFSPAQLPGGGGGWSASPIVVETYIDGRQVAVALAPHSRTLERSKR